jgi:hypothetical protein
MPSPNTKVTRNGQVLTQRVWDMIADVGRENGVTLHVVQGGFKGGGGASASAGTHDSGDVFDLSVDGLSRSKRLAVVNDLREWYGDAWLRTPKYGWTSTGPHIHCVQADSFYALSRGAQQQVVAYNNGRNGLANNGRDPHPRPTPRRHFTVVAPVPPPVPPVHTIKEGTMFLASVQYGTNGTSFWLVGHDKGMVGVGSDEAASWTGARIHVNDEATWRRIIAKMGPQ